LREIIRRYKFHGLTRLGGPLAELLSEAFERHFADQPIDYLLPVPLSPRRLKERGYDQTGLLARQLALQKRIPLLRGVSRNRHTLPQVGLDVRHRRKNLRNAFSIRPETSIHDASILVVDDVMTTGVTVNELAVLIKKAGASTVLVLTVARVGSPFG